MSWQAMGAVQEHSRFRVNPDDFVAFRIMLALAWNADENGVVGKSGFPRECPKRETIAARANVHPNTVSNYLPLLARSGELAYNVYGRGRGAHTVYQILLPMASRDNGRDWHPPDDDNGTRNGTSPQAGEGFISADLGRLILEKLDLMAQEIAQIKQGMTQNATNSQGGDVAIVDQSLVAFSELMAQETPQISQEIPQNGTSPQADDVDDPYDPIFDPNTSSFIEDAPPKITQAEKATATAAGGDVLATLTPEEQHRLVEYATVLDGRSLAMKVYTALYNFPGHEREGVLVKQLGEMPNVRALRAAVAHYRASGRTADSLMTICEWYRLLRRDPSWTPEVEERDEQAELETRVLLEFWQSETGSFAPSDPAHRAQDYTGPLRSLWLRVGRDTERAKTLLREKRREMLQEGKTPYRPAAIVPAIVASLDGATKRKRNGYSLDPQPAADNGPVIWSQ